MQLESVKKMISDKIVQKKNISSRHTINAAIYIWNYSL